MSENAPALAVDPPGPPPDHLYQPARRSLEELVTSSMPLVRWLAWHHYQAEDARRAGADAEDVAQEILLRAVKQFRHFDPARGQFSTWLGVIARDVASSFRQFGYELDGAVVLDGTAVGADGDAAERVALLADPNAVDPAAGVALVKVLVPVCEYTAGAVPTAWVRDARSGVKVQVPTADAVNWHGRLFALADSFDEGDDGLHRVRFGNDAVGWVNAAVRG